MATGDCCEPVGWQAKAPAPHVGQTLSSVNPHQDRCRDHRHAPHDPAVAGIAKGLFFLTISVVHGGVRLVRTAVEGAVWGPSSCGCRPERHCCCVECRPPVYTGSGG